jgi:hypothetical protein
MELRSMAQQVLDPKKLQIHVVADKTIPVQKADGQIVPFEQDLKDMARMLGLPFREIDLR